MQRGERTEELLIQAWRLLSSEANGTPLTIKRLCERAGVNRGTFYLHFENLDEIRFHEEERIIRTILSFTERFNRRAISGTDPVAELIDVFSPLLNYFVAHREDIPLMLMLIDEGRFRERIHSGIRINLERWFGHRLDNDPDALYVVQYMSSAILGVVSRWLGTGAVRPPSEIVSIIVHLSWHGPLHWKGERSGE